MLERCQWSGKWWELAIRQCLGFCYTTLCACISMWPIWIVCVCIYRHTHIHRQKIFTYPYFPFIRRLCWKRVSLEGRQTWVWISQQCGDIGEGFFLFPCLHIGDNSVPHIIEVEDMTEIGTIHSFSKYYTSLKECGKGECSLPNGHHSFTGETYVKHCA